MAQHDFNIANQSFPSFRSDLNAFLQAVGSTHSGTSLPSGAVAGLIWLDTTNATIPLLKYYDGADNITLATINHSTNSVVFTGVGATELSSDTTPQLGGDLDVQTNKVVTTANRNVLVYPNGTGVLEVGGSTNSGRIQLNCEQNTHGIKLASPPHSAGQSYTLTFPTTAPTANKVLQTDGSGNLSFASVSGGIEWQAVHTSATLSATANYGYFINTTSNACTVTLPASPVIGNQIALVDYAGTFDTNALTINPNGNKIEGATANLQLTGEREGVLLTFTDATQGWLATSGINEGTDALSPITYSVDFLVIAGGGAGGGGTSGRLGGGGAGGYRNSFSTEASGGGGSSESSLTFTGGTVYTITVGAGGASVTNTRGTAGNNSSISGSNISTITSSGGGGGGGTSLQAGSNGGSGGGAGDSTPGSSGGSGTANQGFAGGSSSDDAPGYGGAGGGGASAVGVNGTSSTPGAGGNGLASSISGSSVTRAGGGGASYSLGGSTGASGGTGGGGAGAPNGGSGTNGTANTGSGAGGGGASTNSGAGGKGVVILSMPLANFSGTVTGSPTESDDGTTKRLIFNDSGSYTG